MIHNIVKAKLFLLPYSLCLALSTMSGQSLSGPNEFSVPSHPRSFLEENEQKRTAWQRVKQQCTPIDVYEIFKDQSCLEALTDYFLNEPVWAYSQLEYYDRRLGLQPLPIKQLNFRPTILPFGYSDLQADDIPYWRDIFDDDIRERGRNALRVISSPKCESLSTRASTGIQHELAAECTARELFKYATYLDGCILASQRTSMLVNDGDFSRIFLEESGSVYKVVREIIEEKITSVVERTRALNNWEKGLLHAIWMNTQCSKHGYVMLADIEFDESMEFPESYYWKPETVRMFQKVNKTHDVLLKIAAKSGDSWAIRSYPLGILTSSEFNEDVQRDYPILFHRHLGSPTGWFRSELTTKEKAQHRAQAYLLLKSKLGEKKARLEYDPSELKEAIEFVSTGHKLKYPRTREEIFE